MRGTIAALLLALGAQSPIYNYQRELESRRREALRRDYEEEVRARPTAVVFRLGRPLAWMTVVDGLDEVKHCGIPTEAFVFDLRSRQVWKCTPDGARTPLVVDYAVLLATGSVQLIEWKGGASTERQLR